MDYFWSPNKTYGRKRRRKEKKRKKGRDQAKVWMLTLVWIFVWYSQVLCEGPCNGMVRSCPKPRVVRISS